MIRLEMNNYNMILIEKLLKYKLFHQAKLISMNILPVEKYYHLINNIIEQAKFTYSPLGKAFEKQVETIEDQGKKQVEALENLKSKEQTKANKDKPEEINNQPRATIIFNELISKRKKIMSDLYDTVDKNKLYFGYVDPTKDMSFYEYMNSKELFIKLKNNGIRFSDALKNQEVLLKKMK